MEWNLNTDRLIFKVVKQKQERKSLLTCSDSSSLLSLDVLKGRQAEG